MKLRGGGGYICNPNEELLSKFCEEVIDDGNYNNLSDCLDNCMEIKRNPEYISNALIEQYKSKPTIYLLDVHLDAIDISNYLTHANKILFIHEQYKDIKKYIPIKLPIYHQQKYNIQGNADIVGIDGNGIDIDKRYAEYAIYIFIHYQMYDTIIINTGHSYAIAKYLQKILKLNSIDLQIYQTNYNVKNPRYLRQHLLK